MCEPVWRYGVQWQEEQRGESGQEVWKHRGVMKQLAKVSDGRERRARQEKVRYDSTVGMDKTALCGAGSINQCSSSLLSFPRIPLNVSQSVNQSVSCVACTMRVAAAAAAIPIPWAHDQCPLPPGGKGKVGDKLRRNRLSSSSVSFSFSHSRRRGGLDRTVGGPKGVVQQQRRIRKSGKGRSGRTSRSYIDTEVPSPSHVPPAPSTFHPGPDLDPSKLPVLHPPDASLGLVDLARVLLGLGPR